MPKVNQHLRKLKLFEHVFGSEFWDRLILEAHEEVQKIRREKGLPEWKFDYVPRPKQRSHSR